MNANDELPKEMGEARAGIEAVVETTAKQCERTKVIREELEQHLREIEQSRKTAIEQGQGADVLESLDKVRRSIVKTINSLSGQT